MFKRNKKHLVVEMSILSKKSNNIIMFFCCKIKHKYNWMKLYNHWLLYAWPSTASRNYIAFILHYSVLQYIFFCTPKWMVWWSRTVLPVDHNKSNLSFNYDINFINIHIVCYHLFNVQFTIFQANFVAYNAMWMSKGLHKLAYV